MNSHLRMGGLIRHGLITLLIGLSWLSYSSGQETKVPASESLKSLRERAEQGHARAQCNLGIAYYNGEGVAQNYAEAVRWFRKAAEQGDATAQLNLGVMYADGEGMAQSYAEARRWFRKAAEQGHARAQANLSSMYGTGRGVAQDYVQAHMWINLAASHARGDDQKKFADVRDALARMMTSEQIAEAQRLARGWKPKTAQEPRGESRK